MDQQMKISKQTNFAFGLAYLIILLTAWGVQRGGGLEWLGVIIIFLIIPFLEYTFRDWKFESRPSVNLSSEMWLWASPIVLTLVLVVSGLSYSEAISGTQKAGIILSTGTITGAFGITIAHELVHRKDAWERALGVWNLMLVNFGHWGVEHVFGHHKSIGTPEDQASATRGQTLYNFWMKDYFGGLVNSFRFEQKRLLGKKFSFFRNRIINYFGFSAFMSFLLWILNPQILIFWWLQSLVAIILLLSVDYIEHYGLRRQMKENGIYEPVKVEHSWDSRSFLTNALLFNLGLHSHHHMKARLKYQELEEQPKALYMPYGYSVMILMAFIPPLYFRVMDPLIPNS
jgi:alkane 1-monooxygenase